MLDAAAAAGRTISKQISSFSYSSARGAHCKAFCAEANICIAHSGVIPEPLFTHDPSPSLQSYIQRHAKLCQFATGNASEAQL